MMSCWSWLQFKLSAISLSKMDELIKKVKSCNKHIKEIAPIADDLLDVGHLGDDVVEAGRADRAAADKSDFHGK